MGARESLPGCAVKTRMGKLSICDEDRELKARDAEPWWRDRYPERVSITCRQVMARSILASNRRDAPTRRIRDRRN